MSKRNVIITSLFLVLFAVTISCVAKSAGDKEVIPPSDVYAIDYECDSETTSGMAKWAVAMKQKEDAKVKVLTKKLKKGRSTELSVALDNETACWERVCVSINTLNAKILELQYWFGGSMGAVAKVFVPLNVSFIRRASLEEDIVCLEKHQNQTIKDGMGVDAKTLFASISTAIESVDINSVDSEMFTENYGSKADYIKRLNLCKQDATQVEADIRRWLNARKKVEDLLGMSESTSYRLHTYKVINSLANCFNNDVEG